MRRFSAMATGYALACALGALVIDSLPWPAWVALALGGLVGGFVLGTYRPGRWIAETSAVVWLAVLPAWGFWLNHDLPGCIEPCEGMYRALDGPGVSIVAGSYALSLLAYGLHWVRPTPRHPGVEALLITGLGQGAFTCMVLTVHFMPASGAGLVFGAIGLPLVAPGVAAITLGWAIRTRLAALARREQTIASGTLAATLGLWMVLSWFTGPYLGAFTRTCGWTLSQMTPPDADCHYLCTVAAQGSPTLVRPLRMGRRRGRPIVVNRQLAVANAFEDLLHERWPWFGRLARGTYDWLARDVSRQLCTRWVANAVYLAMLPAQVGFELFLLAFDPGDPEARIDRMYR